MVKYCSVCGKEMDRFSGVFCRACLKKHNKETRELKREYKKQGLCPNCGRKPMFGHNKCKHCVEVHRKTSNTYLTGYNQDELKLDLLKLKEELENENIRKKDTK